MTQVALAWLLHRARNILLISGTTIGHLEENMKVAELVLSQHELAQLAQG